MEYALRNSLQSGLPKSYYNCSPYNDRDGRWQICSDSLTHIVKHDGSSGSLKTSARGTFISKVKVDNQGDYAAKSYIICRYDLLEELEKVNPTVGDTITYHVLYNNCEHYVLGWRYGWKWSSQSPVTNVVQLI